MAFVWDLTSFALGRTGWRRFLSSFLFFYAQIILTEFLLGLVYGLTSLFLTLLNIVVSGIILAIVVKKTDKGIFARYWITLKAGVARVRKDIFKDRPWVVLAVVAALLLLWVIFIGLLFPSIDFDGNSYHLPFIGYAIQNHAIYDIPTSLGWLDGYPKGGELIEMWSVMISHNDMLVDLSQVPFLFLGMAAVYIISRRLGVDKKYARFTAILYLFLPIVLNQLKTTYIDVMLCSLFFAGIAQVLQKKLSRLDLTLLGVILSLIIAIKDTGVLFVIVIAPLLIWNLYVNRVKTKSFARNFLLPLLFVFIPTLFGFYWYIKNGVMYGNPIYPYGLTLGGLRIFPGKTFQDAAAAAINSLTVLPSGCVDRIWFVWTEQQSWYGCLYNYDANFSGLGPIWFVVLIPAVLASIYFMVKKKNYLYIALMALIIGLFAIYPLDYYSRYTMFITLLGLISLGIVLSNIGKRLVSFTRTLLIILAIVVCATNFTLCNYSPDSIRGQIVSILHGNPKGPLYNSAIGTSYVFLQNKIKAGETVAYDSDPYFIYDLWNSNYSDKVTYIPAPSEAKWFDGLKGQHVRYVFTNIDSQEHGWLKSDADVKSIYKDDMYEIYQLY